MKKKAIDVRKLKNPLATAIREYLESEDGSRATDPTTLGAAEDERQYLRNRIEAAFIAGWDAALEFGARQFCFRGPKPKAK